MREKCSMIFINGGSILGFIMWITAGWSRAKASDLDCSEDKLNGDMAVSSSARSDLVPWYK